MFGPVPLYRTRGLPGHGRTCGADVAPSTGEARDAQSKRATMCRAYFWNMFLQKSSILVILETICPFIYSFLLKKLKESWSDRCRELEEIPASRLISTWPTHGLFALQAFQQLPCWIGTGRSQFRGLGHLGAATCLTCLTCPGVMCPMSGCIGLNTIEYFWCARVQRSYRQKWPNTEVAPQKTWQKAGKTPNTQPPKTSCRRVLQSRKPCCEKIRHRLTALGLLAKQPLYPHVPV